MPLTAAFFPGYEPSPQSLTLEVDGLPGSNSPMPFCVEKVHLFSKRVEIVDYLSLEMVEVWKAWVLEITGRPHDILPKQARVYKKSGRLITSWFGEPESTIELYHIWPESWTFGEPWESAYRQLRATLVCEPVRRY